MIPPAAKVDVRQGSGKSLILEIKRKKGCDLPYYFTIIVSLFRFIPYCYRDQHQQDYHIYSRNVLKGNLKPYLSCLPLFDKFPVRGKRAPTTIPFVCFGWIQPLKRKTKRTAQRI